MTRTRTLVAHCRMRSEGQVGRVLECMRQLGFLKNLLAELDEGIHRHNRRAATHGLQPVQGAKLFARIPGHNRDDVTGHEAERLVAYPRKEELTRELTRTLEMLRAEHPDDPLAHIPVTQLRGAIHDYLGCRQHASKRGRFKRVSACQSIRWTALPKLSIEGREVKVNGGSLGTLRARLERALEVGEEVDQVKLVRRQLGCPRVCPSRFELHITVSVRPPKPKYVKPGPMTEAQREQRRAKQREARAKARELAREEKEREAKVKAEREATERGRICGADLGGRHTAVDDTDRRLTARRRDRHLRRAEARAISRKRRGSRGWKKACAQRRKNESRIVRRNHEQRMRHAAVTVKEHDIVVTDDADLRTRLEKGGTKGQRVNRSLREAAAGEFREVNRSLREAAAGEFREMLDYQAAKRGKLSVRAEPAGTTEQCIACGSRETKANAASVTCNACGERTPRDAAGGANLALKWIARVETTGRNGPSRSEAPGGNLCPRSRSWSVTRRSLLRRGPSAERLRPLHDHLVEWAMGSWGGEPPRKDSNSGHVGNDRNSDHSDQI